MTQHLTLQHLNDYPCWPNRTKMTRWIKAALLNPAAPFDITIRLVDLAESQALNDQFRHKKKPTNILTFPYDPPPDAPPSSWVGDLVLCAPYIISEANEQHKTLEAHCAHLLVHGMLHLQGFDHIEEKDANIMETREIDILKQLGFANPYKER